jgi:hypothetical protein
MTNEKKLEDLTTDEIKELKIEFAPGCFDNFEGTQEELDALIADIKNMLVSGEILENSRELNEDDFAELPLEVQEQIARTVLEIDDAPKRTLN